MIGQKYSEDQTSQILIPSFVLRERERTHTIDSQIFICFAKNSLLCVRVGTVCSSNS